MYVIAIATLAINVAQETRIPSEMCVGETCITDVKHASLVICVWGNTHPYGYVCGKQFTRGNTHPYDTGTGFQK